MTHQLEYFLIMGIVENRKVEIMEDRNLKMQLLNEHDACGIGAVVNIDGRKDYTVVDRALQIVEKLEHRAGKDASGKVGDGVGILLQISHHFFKKVAALQNINLNDENNYGSSDGFSSASASLLVHGKRTSVPAKLAHGIIVDTQVIRTAPEKFIYSGIGDMVSKITALYDWIFEEAHGAGVVNDFAVMVAKKAVNSFVRTPYESIKDELFLKELVDSLAMSGIANEIAGSSAPTSGSEHLISHALDKILEHPQLHGIQVGIATYIMSVVQNHRYVRVCTVLKRTGFFDYAATLGMRKQDFLDAIDMAPSMKPFRHTYLHEKEYRDAAKKLVLEDDILNKILV